MEPAHFPDFLKDSMKQQTIVITTYEPHLDKWKSDMKTRRKH